MANQLVTVTEAAQSICDSINKAAEKHSVRALNLARLFGYSIGAPIDISDLTEPEGKQPTC